MTFIYIIPKQIKSVGSKKHYTCMAESVCK